MLNELLTKVKGISKMEYPRIWCELNSTKIPREFYNILNNPSWYLLHSETRENLIWEVMEYIKETISEKECLRYWNKDRMPGIEFDIWWQNPENHEISKDHIDILKKLMVNSRPQLN